MHIKVLKYLECKTHTLAQLVTAKL